MIGIIKQWYGRHFSDPQVVILALTLTLVFTSIILLGDILAPVIAAIVLAYLLDSVVTRLNRYKIPRLLAVIVVLLIFIALIVVFFGVMNLLTQQITQLVRALPGMLAKGQDRLLHLPELYPTLFSEQQIQDLIVGIRKEFGALGQQFVSVSLSSAISVFAFTVYVILVPMLVFFILKDKESILAWGKRFLPGERNLLNNVWRDVDLKIGSYIRGKFIEILIIWAATYILFAFMGLDYALLLSFLVGISVIIPYVGAIVVTVPVALIAYFQWGVVPDFWYLMLGYLIIQVLDGNLLVPVLFSEVVNLHPVAIIVAILFFGSLWGVWGIFFAIPLATLVDTVINAWPAVNSRSPSSSQAK